jgi:2-phospho-L-lactate guanylyltransferase (CobY/MobA/RfbA family)
MTQWAVVVTVKRMPDAKTRLALPAPLRADVVLAMLRDTLAAARHHRRRPRGGGRFRPRCGRPRR